jgi:hypothetical protein
MINAESMDKLRRKTFFSGSNTEKNNGSSKMQEEIVYEGQIVNDCIVREEQTNVGAKTKENKKNRFFANYNMFF